MWDILTLLWLPVGIILAAILLGSLSWFVFVRSIKIPWDDRNRKNS